jgi:hypothetical protein
MHRPILITTTALALSTAALSNHVSAMTAATPSGLAIAAANMDITERTATHCGPKGCRHYSPRRYSHMAPAPDFPLACPQDYYYACKAGPLGYRECACWPYRTGWSW